MMKHTCFTMAARDVLWRRLLCCTPITTKLPHAGAVIGCTPCQGMPRQLTGLGACTVHAACSSVQGQTLSPATWCACSIVSQGYTEMGEIASQQITDSQEGGLLQKAKEQGQRALDAVSSSGQKEHNQQQRREEQAQKDRQRAAEEAEQAKQTVVGSIQQTAQEGLQAASDLLQGISTSAGQQAGQADAEARMLAQHH